MAEGNGSEQPQAAISLDEFRRRSSDPKRERTAFIYVPEVDGHIQVRGLRISDHAEAELAATTYDRKGNKKIDDAEQRYQIIIRGVVSPALEPTDSRFIRNWSVGTAMKVTNAIMTLSGIETGQVPPVGGITGPRDFSEPPANDSTSPPPGISSMLSPPDKADGSSPPGIPQ